MEKNNTVSSERTHIGIFGLRNVGKSSIINSITNQNIAIVSDTLGTTTDPVKKTMELLPLGPVVIIDTPGIDDIGELGMQRIKKTKQVLNQVDIALLIVDATVGLTIECEDLISSFKEKNIPYLIVYNKSDLLDSIPNSENNKVYVSAKTNLNIDLLKDKIASFAKKENKKILSDIVSSGDIVVLVIPIDEAAPKGRLILPQQQVLRELLEIGATSVVSTDINLKDTLNSLSIKPKLVITDSQAFGRVNKIVPEDILLTSFSILFARYKGNLETLIKGVKAIDNLSDGDTVLISEGCTHHRQCNDIGSVKIPNWLKNYTNKNINFEFTSGTEFPEDLSKYSVIIHCGGCMINEREMHYRLNYSKQNNIPITNYGITIAQIHGILKRSLEPFEERKILE